MAARRRAASPAARAGAHSPAPAARSRASRAADSAADASTAAAARASPPPPAAPAVCGVAELGAPSALVAGVALLLARLAGVAALPLVTDCDETFNYFEPAHFLLYGRGLQTWEYDPAYALRSWGYAALHAAAGFALGGAAGADKVAVFFRLRALLAAAAAAGDAALYAGVAARFGPAAARYALAGLLCSAGLAHAGPAFLPSSFTMAALAAATGLWLLGREAAAVAAAAAGLVGGWPFAAVAAAPVLAHAALSAGVSLDAVAAVLAGGRGALAALGRVVTPAGWALARAGAGAGGGALAAFAALDRALYGEWTVAAWNLIKYNALGVGGGGRGSDLYGVEPPSYYARNLALNFGVTAAAAALAPLAVLALAAARAPAAGHAAALVAAVALWLGVMTPRPHKEERFLFPVYPLLPVAAALALAAVEGAAAAGAARACRGGAGGSGSGRGGGGGGGRGGARGGGSRGGASAAAAAAAAAATRTRRRAALALTLAYGAASAAGGAARVGALRAYTAPLSAWAALAAHVAPRGAVPLSARPLAYATRAAAGWGPGPGASAPGARACVGKEWYRFPASFFLPDATRADAAAAPEGYARAPGGPLALAFVRAGFTGQLPQPFLGPPLAAAASARRAGFNDENREEGGRYVEPRTCDYAVDLQLPARARAREREGGAGEGGGREPWFEPGAGVVPRGAGGRGARPCACREAGARPAWRAVFNATFLHAESSAPLARALSLPGALERALARARGGAAAAAEPPARVYGTYWVVEKTAACVCGPVETL